MQAAIFDENRVNIYDLESQRLVASVDVPEGPVAAVFSRDGIKLFVVSLLARVLSEIDVESGAVDRTVELVSQVINHVVNNPGSVSDFSENDLPAFSSQDGAGRGPEQAEIVDPLT